MPGLIDYNLDKIPDEELAEDGEHNLKIEHAELKTSKNGRPMISLRFSFPESKNISTLFHNVSLPAKDDDDTKANTILRMLKEFCVAFGAELPAEDEDLIGLEGKAMIRYDDDPEYGERNIIKRFVKA